ncbi:MAG: alginate lyase family protein, partial [Nitrospiraceae bacterium]
MKMLERFLGFRCAELSDDQLRSQFCDIDEAVSMDQVIVSIMKRMATSGASLFASWHVRAEIPALMASRFPGAAEEIIERADRVCAFQFDLLGFTGLQFGCPINWHLEPMSGRCAPVKHWSRVPYLDPQVAGDKKITWELNRHQFFVTLGQAYCLTGDERYTEAFMAQVWSWMEANPPKQGIAWTSSLELALRVISWVWALHLFAGSSRLSMHVVQRMLKYLLAQGRHIETYLSHYFSPNTHLTGEALGLFYLGSSLPELQIAGQWKTLGLKILLQQLPKHVHKDGVYFEQSTYYHRYTTDIYLHLYLLAKAQGILLPALVKDRLMLLLEHLMWITRPDGTSPYVGDDDGGVLVPLGVRSRSDFRDTLALGAAVFRQPTWKHVAGADCPELLWMLGPKGLNRYDSLSIEPPQETAKSFDQGGYFVVRSGWSAKSTYLMLDCGPHGAMNCGHAHADALSFEYSADGTTWIIDPGTYTYTGDAGQRTYFRSSQAHNT